MTPGLKHARLPCPSPSPRACSNSSPSGQWCHPPPWPLLFTSPLAFNLPIVRVFPNGPALHIRWLNIGASALVFQYLGLISFRIDWFDLAVLGTLKSLLQHHSSKASILRHFAFFMVQPSYPYMTIGKSIDLTRWTFVGKVMSLLFNTLSRFVIAFLPRSEHLLISWLQSPSAVILGQKTPAYSL